MDGLNRLKIWMTLQQDKYKIVQYIASGEYAS